MIEISAAILALVSAAIFAAHALDATWPATTRPKARQRGSRTGT
jgi:hypothetical protein